MSGSGFCVRGFQLGRRALQSRRAAERDAGEYGGTVPLIFETLSHLSCAITFPGMHRAGTESPADAEYYRNLYWRLRQLRLIGDAVIALSGSQSLDPLASH